MKALDILKESYGYDYPLFTDNELDEAIAELEALQEPKTCDGCTNIGTLGCYGCFYHYKDLKDKYEPKNKQ